MLSLPGKINARANFRHNPEKAWLMFSVNSVPSVVKI